VLLRVASVVVCWDVPAEAVVEGSLSIMQVDVASISLCAGCGGVPGQVVPLRAMPICRFRLLVCLFLCVAAIHVRPY
jgi:hypothetical protein